MNFTYFLNNMAINLLNFMSEDYEYMTNVILSPHSLYTCLGVLSLVSTGETKKEFLSIIGHNFGDTRLHSNISRKLLFHRNAAVNHNCYLFSRNTLNQTFCDLANHTFNAHMHSVNMTNSVNASRSINQCVRRSTNGHIKFVITPSEMDSEQNLLILSAVYFKEMWKYPFKVVELNTFDSFLNGPKIVRMMQLSAPMKYLRDNSNNVTIVNLEYANMRFFGLVILPDDLQSLKSYLADFSPQMLLSVLSSLETTFVNLKFPKFDVTSTVKLKGVMQRMGLKRAFNRKHSSFTHLSQQESYLSSISHTSRLIMNENSTCVSLSDFIIAPMKLSMPEQTVVVNRTFIFHIYDSITNALVISSVITDPRVIVADELPSK